MKAKKVDKSSKKVVVIGGGTGTYVTLTALKQLAGLKLSAVVSVADSGGSTGRLRDEFGFLPVGDLRQALAAMASGNEDSWIQRLLLYRFSKGSGLEGHNLGNLILTALQDMSNSTAEALKVASDIFRLQGRVYPVTSRDIQLVVEYQDGTVEIGEHFLDEARHGGKKIVQVKTSPRSQVDARAKQAILAADVIVLSPGDLYASLLANLVVGGVAATIRESRAQLVYILNLMTRKSQTHQMTGVEHVAVIEKQLQTKLDYVIVNNQPFPKNVLRRYAEFDEYPVQDDFGETDQVRRFPLIKEALYEKQDSDTLPRSFLRHDSAKLARVLLPIIQEKA